MENNRISIGGNNLVGDNNWLGVYWILNLLDWILLFGVLYRKVIVYQLEILMKLGDFLIEKGIFKEYIKLLNIKIKKKTVFLL